MPEDHQLRNSSAIAANDTFKTYCESTSLHGWQYIYKSSKTVYKHIELVINYLFFLN